MPLTSKETTNLINQIQENIRGLQAVYLFGSYAKDQNTVNSDIDLAFLSDQPISPVDTWNLAQKLATTAGRDVDLVDLQNVNTVLRAQIISTGQRHYCNDEPACEHFEDLVFSTYVRFNEERREILNDIRQRGSVYDQ